MQNFQVEIHILCSFLGTSFLYKVISENMANNSCHLSFFKNMEQTLHIEGWECSQTAKYYGSLSLF